MHDRHGGDANAGPSALSHEDTGPKPTNAAQILGPAGGSAMAERQRAAFVFQKPFPKSDQAPPGRCLRRAGRRSPTPRGRVRGDAGPLSGQQRQPPHRLRYRHRSSGAAPSSAPSHHCGSADGSSVTSLFLPPCFDPAVLIVQANPTLPALAASQDCY